MKKIKTYQEFQNEEINWKNILTGAALSTSLLLNPIGAEATTQTPTKIELQQLQNTNTLFSKKIIIPGTKEEVITKIVQKIRQNGGYVNIISKEKLTAKFTFNDVKPDNSNGFTNVGIEIIIDNNQVEINFKKIEFFYSGMQPKTPTQQFTNNMRNTGIDALTTLTQRTIKNPILGNRLGSELQKNKSFGKQPQNFVWEEAVNSKSNTHKSFIRSLDKKIDNLINSLI